MAKYIDADELMEYLKEQDEKYTDGLTTEEVCVLIKHYPAADVEPVRKWILCSERLPEPDGYVLTVDAKGFVTTSTHLGGGEFTSYADSYIIGRKPEIVAWMELPEPPKMNGGNE